MASSAPTVVRRLEERQRGRETDHFSQEHQLIFVKKHTDDGVEVSCYGCLQPISGPCYSCSQCDHFFLHKVCAELPKEMQHPMHPQHPLILLPNPPNFSEQKASLYSGLPCKCNACQRPLESFTYNCSICKFNVDIFCALMVQRIEHKCHHHPLTLLMRPGLFLCDACGTRHEGTFYHCTTCQFWVNQKCALSPSTIRSSEHSHLLSLFYSLPREHFKFKSYCEVCTKEMKRSNWAYYCANCKYFAHVNCLTSNPVLQWRAVAAADTTPPTPHHRLPTTANPPPTPPPPLPLLPFSSWRRRIVHKTRGTNTIIYPLLPGECVASYFTKKYSLNGKSKISGKIYHVSHLHPLLFVDKQINDESCSISKPLACDLCAQAITAPFYHCSECKFILHDYCAMLPIELQHPLHPDHPLILNRWKSIYCDLPLFQVCYMPCNGVVWYGCVVCDFFVDVNCASLLGTIAHENHKHSLTLRETTGVRCIACDKSVHGSGFVCDRCNYNLHSRCALLPRAVRHRYDKHPFTLVYFGNEDEYYCEICEDEINPNCWFYHCGECNQALDTKCISPAGQVNFQQQHFVTHEAHEHTLALKETSNVHCAACKHNCYGFVFVCDSCNFALHTRCASLPRTVTHGDNHHTYSLNYSGNLTRCYCSICRRTINKNLWFYHCGDNYKSVHTICIQVDELSIIMLGDKLNVEDHPHLFTSVARPKDISPCQNCGEIVIGMSFECELCNFRLHMFCARNAVNNGVYSLYKSYKLEPVNRGGISSRNVT